MLKTYIVFVFGIDRAGKSSLVSRIKGEFLATEKMPTLGFNIEKFIYENVQFQVLDAPGQKSLRETWSKGYERANILMFVLDGSDPKRFNEAKKEFLNVINNPLTKGLPIIFCIHKTDLENFPLKIDEIKKNFTESILTYRKIDWIQTSIYDLNSIFNLRNSLLDVVLVRAKKAESILNIIEGLRHDLNNQFGIMKAFISLLAEKKLDNESQDYLHSVDLAMDQSLGLLKNFKLELEEKKIKPEPINTQSLLQDSITFISRGSNCQFEVNIEPNIPPISIDTEKFIQIINNLLINAIEAISKTENHGKISISQKIVKITPENTKSFYKHKKETVQLKPGEYTQISIKDNGIGIKTQDHENIFKMYFTSKTEGHGLGLATVYSIVTVNGGFIDFESEYQQGTTFNVYLPV